MSPFGCAREREVTALLRQGYWPEACPAELRAHVETCRICSDLLLVTSALGQERRETMPLVRLEAPGALWWRAQLRRRNAAIEKMARPIFGAQVFALAMSLAVAVVVLVWQAGNWSAWISDLPRVLHLDALLPAGLGDLSGMLWIVPVLATIAVLSGVVVYLVSEKQ
ncbi:MAG TPA: hypothetical protein VGI45_11555 [Terracidiphilus sp.]